ncbi:MAG: hypothetical protein EBY29_15105 [Planctomycetes bacterium]|nr:hypothetical protein [Planctomycetota bacterium]
MESKKKVKIVAPKASFALPFSGEKNGKCCEGLRYNDGLYTQCEVLKKGENKYCAVCEKGNLKYGSIDDRMSAGIMEFKDPSGKSPVHYSKIMKKLKVTKEQVLEEALKMGKIVNEIHLEVQEEKRGRPKAVKVVKEKTEKKKGRPKKEPKGLELENKTTDLFASLIANSVESSSEIDDMCHAEFVKNSEENGVEIIECEPELLKACIAQEKKNASKEEAKALKEQEKALEKAKKEEEKAQAKLLKEQEKALEKAKKEQDKAPKKTVEKKAVENKVVEKKVVEKKVVVEEEEEADVVKKIKVDGVIYLKSKKSGVVYNMEQDVIGKWDDVNQKIIFKPVDAELEEDECESDSE